MDRSVLAKIANQHSRTSVLKSRFVEPSGSKTLASQPAGSPEAVPSRQPIISYRAMYADSASSAQDGSNQAANPRDQLPVEEPYYSQPTGPGRQVGACILSSEERVIRANLSVYREILLLCQLIETHGRPKPGGGMVISFGEVFDLYHVSANLVGILLRARKYGLLDFPGECLFKSADDKVEITMQKTYAEIWETFEYQGTPGITRQPSIPQNASST